MISESSWLTASLLPVLPAATKKASKSWFGDISVQFRRMFIEWLAIMTPRLI